MSMEELRRFKGKYRFLSNFYGVEITYEGNTYLSAEAAFQAAKCLNKDMRTEFVNLSPVEAKRKGRRIAMRRDWGEVKNQVMYEILCLKFKGNWQLGALLLETDDMPLVEYNDGGDIYWGYCNGVGENVLGRLLMGIRAELRLENRNLIIEGELDYDN